jgi:hypothetical protein
MFIEGRGEVDVDAISAHGEAAGGEVRWARRRA